VKLLTLLLLMLFQQNLLATLFKANNFQAQNSGAKSTAVGDINNDGYNDVVMALHQKGQIVIYLNDQENGFIAQLSGMSRTVNQLELADINRDGKLDLLVLSTEGEVPQVPLGPSDVNARLEVFINEEASYNMIMPFISFSTNGSGKAFKVQDFDQDGYLDFIITSTYYPRYSQTGIDQTHLYSGNEDFSFETTNLDLHLQMGSKLADYNQDGFLDIWNLSGFPEVFLFDPVVGFTRENKQSVFFDLLVPQDPNVISSTVVSYSQTLLGDLDGDGDIDVQALGNNGEFLRFLKTDNQFVLSNPELELPLPFVQFDEFHSSDQYGGLMDLNNDGQLDVLLGTNESENLLLVSGHVDDTQTEVLSSAAENRFVSEMLVADFNTDGYSDALSVGANGLILWTNNQQGQLTKKITQDSSWGIKGLIATGQLNQDNHVDVVLAGRNGVVIKHGNGQGAFKRTVSISHQEIQQLVVTDLDQDGLDELIGVYQNKIFKWEQLDTSYKQEALFVIENGGIKHIKAYDFDEDGDIDLSFVNEEKLVLLKNTEQGFVFSQPLQSSILDFVWLNNNKHNELLVFTDRLSDQYDSGFVVYTYNQNQEFEITQVIETTDLEALAYYYEKGMQLFDMDLDGDLDVMVPFLRAPDQGVMWLNKISVDWQVQRLDKGASQLLGFATEFADFNQDGYLDVFGAVNSFDISGVGLLSTDYISLGSENGLLEGQPMELNFGTSGSQLVDLDADGDLDLLQIKSGGFATQLNTTQDVDFSGLWYNPEESGHGLQLEQIDLNGEPAINFSWFAYHEGKPFWLVGLAALDGDEVEIPVNYTDGTGFGSNFDSNEVNTHPWGRVRLSVNQNQLEVVWEPSQASFISGSMSMQRLADIKPVAAGENSINSCHSGSWFNADESGHGFFINVVEIGGVEHMTLAWFNYLAGEQFWLVAQGPLFQFKAQLKAQQSSGGNFPPAFDSTVVQMSDWGYLDFTLLTDTTATIKWLPADPNVTPGELALEKLTLIDRYQCSQ